MPNPEWREKDLSVLSTRPDNVILWLNELLEYTNELEQRIERLEKEIEAWKIMYKHEMTLRQEVEKEDDGDV